MNNLVVKTNGSLSALCSKEMVLEILCKTFQKDATDEFHIYRNTSLNG